MGDRAAHLRSILDAPRRGSAQSVPLQSSPPIGRLERERTAAASLGGVCVETPLGPCVVIDRTYPPDALHGTVRVGDGHIDDLDALGVLGLSPPPWTGMHVTPVPASGRLVYLDLETTGLGGGAGTRAFVVGCGFFEGRSFRTCQLVLASFAGERALLSMVADWMASAGGIVSFNGKAFDLPIMETRWLFHRMRPPVPGAMHLDMLHPARRLWRSAPAVPGPQRYSLGALEAAFLGVERVGDVPGAEIPERYFEYVRTGDAKPLEFVLEHNRLDLVSLAILTAAAARLVWRGAGAARNASECLGLGRVYEKSGRRDCAARCYARAAGLEPAWPVREADVPGRAPGLLPAPTSVRAEALRRLALYLRRLRRYTEAAEVWHQILALASPPPAIELEAVEALAIHHEHRVRDLSTARRFALRAFEADQITGAVAGGGTGSRDSTGSSP